MELQAVEQSGDCAHTGKGKGSCRGPPPPRKSKGNEKGLGKSRRPERRRLHKVAMHGEPVPKWAYSEKAAAITIGLRCYFDGKPLGMYYMGPAVLSGMKANGFLWSFFAIFPWIIFWGGGDRDQQCRHEVSGYFLLLYLPFLCASLWEEWRILQLIVPVYTEKLDGPKVFGHHILFKQWFALVSVGSILAHMDIATTALFVAKTLKAGRCEAALQDAWHLVWSHSGFPLGAKFSIATVVISFWFLMMLQALYVAAHTVPISKVPRTDGGPGGPPTHPVDYDLKDAGETFSQYNTPIVKAQNHQGAILTLAEGARMQSILFQAPLFLSQQNKYMQARWIYPQVRRHALRALLFFTIEHSLMLNLKGTIFMIDTYVSGASDVQVLASIFLSSAMGISNMACSTMQIWGAFTDLHNSTQFDEDINQMDPYQHSELNRSSRALVREEEHYSRRGAKCWLAVYAAACFLAIALIMYAIAKTFLAHVCMGMWNVTSGCIHRHDYAALTSPLLVSTL